MLYGLGRFLVGFGAAIAAVGASLYLAGILLDLAGLQRMRVPGDIVVRGERYTFYFPLGTSLLVSAFGTLLLWLLSSGRK